MSKPMSEAARAAIASRDREREMRSHDDDDLPGRDASEASSRPTHFLSYFNKETGAKGRVGVAWLKPNGSISIKLNALVVLGEGPNLGLTLWPRNERDDQYGR